MWHVQGVLISSEPDQEGNKLMFLSEWREFPSAPCLAGKETWWQLASRCCWNRARSWHASEIVSFLVGLRTYQHLSKLNTLFLPYLYFLPQETTSKVQNVQKKASLFSATLNPTCLGSHVSRVNIMVWWGVKPCSLAIGTKVSKEVLGHLQMKATCVSETLVTYLPYYMTSHRIDHNLNP